MTLIDFTRREMIETLGGGLGSGRACSAILPDVRTRLQAAALGTRIRGSAHCRRKAKHVIILFMTGGPSQLDMFDPKPALCQVLGPAAGGRRPAHRAPDRRAAAVAVRVQAVRARRRRGQRTAAEHRSVHRRPLRDPVDVHVQSDAYAGAQPVLTPGQSCSTRPSIGSWISYGLGTENENLPAFVVLNRGRRRDGRRIDTRAGFLPAEHQGVAVQRSPISSRRR